MGTENSKTSMALPFSLQDLVELKTQVDLESFETISVIGRGTYGKVLLVKKIGQDELYAMKQIRKDIISKLDQFEHIKSERAYIVHSEYSASSATHL
jgi:serine/threonine protein kinase